MSIPNLGGISRLSQRLSGSDEALLFPLPAVPDRGGQNPVYGGGNVVQRSIRTKGKVMTMRVTNQAPNLPAHLPE